VDEMNEEDAELVDVEAVLHQVDVLQNHHLEEVVLLVNKKNINLKKIDIFFIVQFHLKFRFQVQLLLQQELMEFVQLVLQLFLELLLLL
jgi:uncharacterized metal-binding protein